MSAPKHMAAPAYRVLCPDRCVRHEGVFHDPDQAGHWAAEPMCCRLGRHVVVRAEALRGAA